MNITEELDRRVEQVNKRLQEILALFLLGQLSALFAKMLGARAIDEAYASFMTYFKREYGTPSDYNEKANRIMKVLFDLKQDFDNVIDKKGEKQQVIKRALELRTWLIALGFIYTLHAQSTIELAIVTKALYLKWNTMEDPQVCELCEALKGLYDPYGPLPERPHPECRCWWTIIYR